MLVHRILTVSLALTFGAVLGGAGVRMIAPQVPALRRALRPAAFTQ
jgi:hypothetical protein